uniref:hypothetical protein n=1 Tax=Brevundimonas sp. UBA5866 TaxID=1946132 RepID=UPI0025C310FF
MILRIFRSFLKNQLLPKALPPIQPPRPTATRFEAQRQTAVILPNASVCLDFLDFDLWVWVW